MFSGLSLGILLGCARHTEVQGGCKLRGKAAEVRWFGPVMLELWRRHHQKKKQLHIDILQCLQHSVNMEMILEDHPDEVRLPGDLCF